MKRTLKYSIIKLIVFLDFKLIIKWKGVVIIMLDINFNQIVELIEKRKNNAYKKVN